MQAADVAVWMLMQMEREGCLYQDDVVDYLLRAGLEKLTKENAEGNQVLGTAVLDAFRRLTEDRVVWVKPDQYWRWRVMEDEPGREQRG